MTDKWGDIYYLDARCKCGKVVRCWYIEEDKLTATKIFSQQCICGGVITIKLDRIFSPEVIRSN